MTSPEKKPKRSKEEARRDREELKARFAAMEAELKKGAEQIKTLTKEVEAEKIPKPPKKGPEATKEAEAKIEEKKKAVEEILEKKEKTEEARKNLKARLQEAALDEERDLDVVPAWKTLSLGQQNLVIEQISQHVLLHIKELGEQRFKEKNQIRGSINPAKWRPFAFAKKVANNIVKSYWISKEEKNVLTEAKRGLVKPDQATIEALINRTADMDLEVLNDQGKAVIEFTDADDFGGSPEAQQAADAYNKIANEYSRMPDAWRNEKAAKSFDSTLMKNKNFKEYEAKRNEYEAARASLLRMIEKQLESGGASQEQAQIQAMQQVKDMDLKVAMLQFTTTAPNAGEELKRIAKESSVGRLLNNEMTYKAIYAGLGYGLRKGAGAVLGVATGPFAAMIVGGARANIKARGKINTAFSEGRTDETFLERREAGKKGLFDNKNANLGVMGNMAKLASGYDVNTKEIAAFVDADSQIQRLDALMQKLDNAVSDREKADARRALETRIQYVEYKHQEGLINYGSDDKALGNNYALLKKVSEATVKQNEHMLGKILNLDDIKEGIRHTETQYYLTQVKEDGTPYTEAEAKQQAEQAIKIFEEQGDKRGELLTQIVNNNEKALNTKQNKFVAAETVRGATIGAAFSLLGAKVRDWVTGGHVAAAATHAAAPAAEPELAPLNKHVAEITRATLAEAEDAPDTDTVSSNLAPLNDHIAKITPETLHDGGDPSDTIKIKTGPLHKGIVPPINHTPAPTQPVVKTQPEVGTQKPPEVPHTARPINHTEPVHTEKPTSEQLKKLQEKLEGDHSKSEQLKRLQDKLEKGTGDNTTAHQTPAESNPDQSVPDDSANNAELAKLQAKLEGTGDVNHGAHIGPELDDDSANPDLAKLQAKLEGASTASAGSNPDNHLTGAQVGPRLDNDADQNPELAKLQAKLEGGNPADNRPPTFTENRYSTPDDVSTSNNLSADQEMASAPASVSSPEQLLARAPATPIDEIDNYKAPIGINPMRHTTGGVAVDVPVDRAHLQEAIDIAHRTQTLHSLATHGEIVDKIGHDNAVIIRPYKTTVEDVNMIDFSNKYDYEVFHEKHLTFPSYQKYEEDKMLQWIFGYEKGAVEYNRALDKNVYGLRMAYFRDNAPTWTNVQSIPAKYFFDKSLMKDFVKNLPEANRKILETAGLINKHGEFMKQGELESIAKAFAKFDPDNAYPIPGDTIEKYINRLTRLGLHQAKDGTFFIVRKGVNLDAALQPHQRAMQEVFTDVPAWRNQGGDGLSTPVPFTNRDR